MTLRKKLRQKIDDMFTGFDAELHHRRGSHDLREQGAGEHQDPQGLQHPERQYSASGRGLARRREEGTFADHDETRCAQEDPGRPQRVPAEVLCQAPRLADYQHRHRQR